MKNNYEVFSELQKANDNYQRLFRAKEIELTMEDDSSIVFAFHENNTPHLLGVQSTYFSKRRKEFGNMYRFMQHLITNQDAFIEKLHNTEVYFTDIFAPTVFKKIKSFNSVTSISPETFAFLLEYSPYCYSKLENQLCNYYIFITNELKSYKGFLIGINDEGHPITLISINGLNELKAVIGNHPLELIKEVSFKKKGTYKKKHWTSSEKALKKRRKELEQNFTVIDPKLKKQLIESLSDTIDTQDFEISLLNSQVERALTVAEDKEDDLHTLLAEYYEERKRVNQIIASLQDQNARLQKENSRPISLALKRIFRKKQ